MNPKLTRVTAQFCLVLQLAAGGIMPVASASQLIKNNEHHSLFSSRTALYTLKQGDTINSVAKQFNLTPGELKKLNEFRTYSKPFEQLGAGDEVDVPVATSQGTKDTLPADTSIEASKPDAEELFIASSMSTMGGMLDSGDVTHQAAGMARSAAVGAAGGEVEDWLSQFGTAKLRLNVDDDFHLDGSAVDLLVPLYDSNNHVLFTQWGYRNKDSRNTINLGLGARTFQGNWMFGVNTFWDNDMTGHNRRIGFGLEAWTDYLKLSANSYSGITDWHQSRDFADYDERPADGFDIRAEGYLPAYPQLGARVMYEQYTGDEVALFGKDNRQKDPKAVTLGLNYTPVPLLTVGVDHRQGQSGQNDTQINLGVNYRFGMPWLQQISPDAVASTRTLAGSRYDLVDRNNDIVLEYKKQTLIRLSLPQSLRGKAGDTDHVTATVTAKYGTDHVEWNTGELLAAGGMAKEVSKQVLEITYPPFKSEGSNTYRLSAVAYDAKGNTSNQGTTEISVSEPDAGITDGNLKFTVDGAKADGVATDEVVALVTDNAGNGVPGMAVVFTADNGAKIVGGSTVTTDAGGKATITLTNTRAGDVMVTARINSSEVSTKGSFVADGDTADITDGNLVVTTDNARANGADANAVKATVTDANGNAVKDQNVTFSADNGATVASPTVKTDENGIATTTLTNTKAGTANVTAALADGKSATKATTFTADDSTAVIADGALTVTTDNAKANGTDTNAVKAVVTDASGNLVVGTKVTFAASNGAKVLTQSVNTDKNGVATTTLTNTKAGIANVTATLTDGNTANVDTHFKADGDTADITDGNLTVTSDNAKADGTVTNAVQAIVTDAGGNPVEGQVVTFTTDSSTAAITPNPTTGVTDVNGVVKATLTNTKAGVTNVTATLADGNSATKPTTFKADSDTAEIASGALTVTKNNQVANGTDANAVQVIVTDANGNLLESQVVTFTANNGATITAVIGTTGTDGIATATLTNTTTGTSTVTATLSNAKKATVNTNFTADAATSAVNTLDSDVGTQLADGTRVITFTATLKDGNGNPVPDAAVSFTTSGGTLSTPANTDEDGKTTVTLKDTVAEPVTVTAKSTTNTADTGKTKNVTFTADASTAKVASLRTDKDSAFANGRSVITITAKLVDANLNPLTNQDITFTHTGSAGNTSVLNNQTQTDENGEATAELTDTTIEDVTITAKPATNPTGDTQQHIVNFTEVTASKLTISVDNTNVHAEKSINMKIVALDDLGIGIPHAKVTLSLGAITDRQGIDRKDESKLKLNGSGIITPTTLEADENGMLNIIVAEPNGIGLQSVIRATSGETTNSTSVIFSVKTSPNVPAANMWGYLPESVTSNGITFSRPKLNKEITGNKNSYELNNEEWAKLSYNEASILCNLPSKDELQQLVKTEGNMADSHNWSIYSYNLTSTLIKPDSVYVVSLINGSTIGSEVTRAAGFVCKL